MNAVWVVVIILACALIAMLWWGPRLVELWGRLGSDAPEQQDGDP